MSEKNSQVRWQEDELHEAEKQVLHAFCEGWKADDWKEEVSIRDVFPDKPVEKQTVADWKGAVIRADFLRDVFLGNYGDFDPRHITISRAWIEGTLYLDYCESNLPLLFSECIFAEGVSLAGATIPFLNLGDCKIRSDQNGISLAATRLRAGAVFLGNKFKVDGEVNLNGADVGGQVDCDGGTFTKGLRAQNLKAGAVLLRDKFKADGEVNLLNADVGGSLECDGGTFAKRLIAQNLKVGAVFLRNKFKAGGEVHLNGADVGGQVDCDGGTFAKGLTAPNLKASGVLLRNKFKAESEVNLNGADVGGQVDCDGGTFAKGLTAENLKAADVLLRNIKAGGDVNLNGVDIGGNLECDGGTFAEGLVAQNLKASVVFLRNEFEAGGDVNLNGADIGSILACNGGTFAKGLIAPNLKASAVLLGNKFKADGGVNLNGADISGSLVLFDAEINFLIVLDNAKVDAFILGEVRLGRPHSVSAEGFRYQRIQNADGGDLDINDGKKWLALMPKSQFQPYKKLMAAYRHMGHIMWARTIGYEFEKIRGESHKGWGWKIWYVILRWTFGYGYKPLYFLSWVTGLVLGGYLLFSSGHENGLVSKYSPVSAPAFLANEWVPSTDGGLQYWKDNKSPPQGYLEFNPLVYSLEATFPILSLGQLEKWHPSNYFLLGVRWLWTIIGSLLLGILAMFGVGVLGPLWGGDKDD